MGVTISTHNGSAVSHEHNVRNKKVVSKEEHIDPNGIYEVWHDENIRSAYDRLFGQALEDYNSKQTREDRKIDSYYRAVKGDAKKHVAYEMIISIGSSRGEQVPDDVGKAIMRDFVDNWSKRNGHSLELIGAFYHADEQGVPHVHIDYIPVAHGYTKGLETQTGLVRALGDLGFEKNGRETAQIQWERRENKYLESLCLERGINVEHPLVEGRKHIHTEQFKKEQELSRVIDHTNDLERHIQNQDGQIKKNMETIENQEELISRLKGEYKEQKDVQMEISGKTLFGRPRETVTISYEDFRTLQRISRETKDLKTEQRALKKQENEFFERRKTIEPRIREAERLQKEAEQDRAEAQKYLEDQKSYILGTAQKLALERERAILQDVPGKKNERMKEFMKEIKFEDGSSAWEMFEEQEKELAKHIEREEKSRGWER